MFKAGLLWQLLLIIFQQNVSGNLDMNMASDEMSHHLWSAIIEESREFILNKIASVYFCRASVVEEAIPITYCLTHN